MLKIFEKKDDRPTELIIKVLVEQPGYTGSVKDNEVIYQYLIDCIL